MKRKFAKKGSFLLLLLLLLVLPWFIQERVFAASETGSITIKLKDLETPKDNVEFKIYPIGGWNGAKENWELDSRLEDTEIVLSALKGASAWKTAAQTLSMHKALGELGYQTGTTDENGEVQISGLSWLMYLVVQTDKGQYGTIDPFLVSVPYVTDGVQEADRIVSPKAVALPKTEVSIEQATIELSQTSYTYDGTEKKPTATVKLGDTTLKTGDYTVAYSNNINAGTAKVTITGKGNYTGTTSTTFKINAASIASAKVTLSQTSYTYDGTEKKPTVTVKLGDTTLKTGDYTVAYSGNINAGTAKVTITGKGNYTGTASTTFKINAASIKNAKVTLKTTSYTYNGKEKKPSVTVTLLNGKKLTKKTHYNVEYSNNKNIGTATVKIKGTGNYKGTISKTFTIKAKKETTFTYGKNKYKVTGTSTVAFKGIASKKTTKVTIPKTVEYGGKTFNVTSIADGALKKKTKVTQVTIDAKVKTIGASAFEGCKRLSKVTIGSAVTMIEDKAFKNCTALESITIQSKVTKLDKQAFYGCKNLKTITIKSTELKTVGKEAFKGIHAKATIKVPKSKLSSYRKLLKDKGQGSNVTIKK